MSEDYDPRLVDLYDVDNPDGPDHDYYRALADEYQPRSIVDLGCGTGMLTVTLAQPDRTVVGIDPSAHMLNHARRRPGAERVLWRQGDSRSVPPARFEYAVMTGNVAQHIPDPEWQRTLADLRGAANPGALLAFESRNPVAGAWRSWQQHEPTVRETIQGPLREWSAVREVSDGQVLLTCFNLFEATGELITDQRLLTFRDRVQIESQLSEAGFLIQGVWGGWNPTPLTGSEAIMIFEARCRSTSW